MKNVLFVILLLVFYNSTQSICQTVYKTRTGTKYHTSSHYPNSTPISLSDALKQGLGPCSVCKPSQQVNEADRIASPINNSTQTVYKTKTGTKYHTSGHHANSIPISLSDALNLGLGACAICKPSSQANSTQLLKQPTTPSTSSRQCSGTTKAGPRCKRMTTDPGGYCYQHKQ
jgi:hypothetical protein